MVVGREGRVEDGDAKGIAIGVGLGVGKVERDEAGRGEALEGT